MLRLKKKYVNKNMSNGILGNFNTSEINESNIYKYIKGGFSHIFEEVKEKKKSK